MSSIEDVQRAAETYRQEIAKIDSRREVWNQTTMPLLLKTLNHIAERTKPGRVACNTTIKTSRLCP